MPGLLDRILRYARSPQGQRTIAGARRSHSGRTRRSHTHRPHRSYGGSGRGGQARRLLAMLRGRH